MVVDVLLAHPEAGAQVDRELRHFILRRFLFPVVYAFIGDVLLIVAVAHECREPEYWRSRVMIANDSFQATPGNALDSQSAWLGALKAER